MPPTVPAVRVGAAGWSPRATIPTCIGCTEGPGPDRIGEPGPEPGTIRWLIKELALLPMEGGARVAILEHAERLNEPAQQALLKTLEEPPAGVTIDLGADDEERLLPTVRSRCARIRLGPVSGRDIEGVLGDLGLADAPTAARLARLAEGRPGLAVAYARAPEAVAIRGEVARALLDLLGAGPADRLRIIRELLGRAAAATAALAEVTTPSPRRGSGEGRQRGAAQASPRHRPAQARRRPGRRSLGGG
jgi:DNA polymerase-3 subunit delta'